MKYLFNFQGTIDETTQVRSKLDVKRLKTIKDIPELFYLLSFGLPEGKVGFTLLYVNLQSDNSIVASDETVITENILASTTSTHICEGDESGNSEGNIDFYK